MPVNTVQEIIVVKAPDFLINARLDDLIDLAKLSISETALKDKYEFALALHVLHIDALSRQGGGSDTTGGSSISGAISKKKEGQLEINFNTPALSSGSGAFYGQTAYGTELWQLYRSCFTLFMNRCT